MWSKPFFLALATFAVQLGLNFLLAALRDLLDFSSVNSFSFCMYFGVHLLAAAAAGCFYAAKHQREPHHMLKRNAAIYYGLIWAAFIGFTFFSNARLLDRANRWASWVALIPASSLFGLITYLSVGTSAYLYLKAQKKRL
jgi:hypothetical protein